MNVLEMKNRCIGRAGVKDHFAFCALSVPHARIWFRLNAIGARALDLMPLPPDIDEAVETTASEVEEIESALSAAERGRTP